MEQLERFEETRGIVRARHAIAREQRIAQRIGTRERAGVRKRQRRTLGRSARLERDQRHPGRAGGEASLREPSDRSQPFQMQPYRTDPLVPNERLDQVRRGGIGAIAHRDDVTDRQPARLHREIERQVAALAYDRNAPTAIDRPGSYRQAAMLVGPQRHSVEQVEHAVAIRPDERHAFGSGKEFGLSVLSIRTAFGKTRRITYRAARAAGRQFARQSDGGWRRGG